MFSITPDKKMLSEEEKKLQELEDENAMLEKLGESMWLTDMFVDYPKSVIFFGMVIVTGFVVAMVILESYWPSSITNRDLVDYGDMNTQMWDTEAAALIEIQEKSTPDGVIPLQSVTKQDWWLNIAVECTKPGCDNILTPEGIHLINEIDRTIEEDPDWPKVCLLMSPTNQTCASDPTGKIAKVSPLVLFKTAYGEDLSEITQFAVDFALFGLAYSEELFNQTLPLFSKDYNRTHRKSKMIRFVVQTAGPINFEGVRYKNLGDRNSD